MPGVTDAEQQYYELVAEDCARVLGPGIELNELELDSNGDVVLRLNYRLGQEDWTSEGHGETVIAAHAALRDQLVVDRLRIGFQAICKTSR